MNGGNVLEDPQELLANYNFSIFFIISLWKNKILNVFVLFIKDNIYSINQGKTDQFCEDLTKTFIYAWSFYLLSAKLWCCIYQ